MRPEEKVSVIIPAHNYGRFIGAAIESVVSQTRAPLEVLVVDDGSTDDTEEKVRAFSEVKYFRKERGGVSSARNLGVSNSRGEYIAFVDADDTWVSTKLEKQLDKFRQDTEIGLVHCGVRRIDTATGEINWFEMSGAEGWVIDDLVLYQGPQIMGPGSTIVVRRDVFEDVGGYDQNLTHGEDWEFCVRVAKKYKIGFVEEALVNYRGHGANAHLNIGQMETSTLLAWSKIFEDPSLERLRRRSYGNLHRILAGSFYHNGEYLAFIRNAVKSIWYKPSGLLDLMSAAHKRSNDN